MRDSMEILILGIGLLLTACSASTRGQADEGQAMTSTSAAVEPTSTSGATSTSSPSPTTSGGDATSDASGTTTTTGISDTGTTNDATTGEDSDGACLACESLATACEASRACQAVAAFAPDCPAETRVNCVVQNACENLTLENVIEGLRLWSKLYRCVARECGPNPVCLTEEDACGGNPACAQVQKCVEEECACLPEDQVLTCWDACGNKFPDGRDDWTAWVSCLLAKG